MKGRKWIAVLMVVVLLLQVSLPLGVQGASKLETSPLDIPGLRSPVQQWSDTELKQFVEVVVAEDITVPEAQRVWKQLSPVQRKRVGELLAVRTGVSIDEWRRFVKRNAERSKAMKNYGSQVLGFPGEIWREPIENTWTSGHPPGSTYASSYWNSPLCDDDPSDPDWAFYFYQPYEWYSRNPDGLRWTSDSVQVYVAFMVAYGGNLNGYSFSWDEAHLCIGTNGVKAAGGPDKVRNNLFLSPNH